MEGLDGINMVTTYASGARQQSTPSIQALAGVRVVAALLGFSCKKKSCVLAPKHRWIAWAPHPASPRAQITHTATGLSPVWGELKKKGPSARHGEGQISEGLSARRGLKDNVKDGKTTCGASIHNTPSLEALVRVRVVVSLLGRSRKEALCSPGNTQVGHWGLEMGKVTRRPGQDHPEKNAPNAREKGIG